MTSLLLPSSSFCCSFFTSLHLTSFLSSPSILSHPLSFVSSHSSLHFFFVLSFLILSSSFSDAPLPHLFDFTLLSSSLLSLLSSSFILFSYIFPYLVSSSFISRALLSSHFFFSHLISSLVLISSPLSPIFSSVSA